MQIEHSEFQDQLVRGLAHRMNNILTLFHGYLGLLLDNKHLDQATLEGLARCKEGARAASELMDRTHSLVRPSTVVWREIDLGEMIRVLRTGFDSMCGPKTRIELRCPDDLPRISADMGRVKTAIVEIVRNACEATATGGRVRIELHADEPAPPPSPARQETKWISVTVTDSGPGIPVELQEKIFAPFYSTKKKRNAVGLGLTVAQGFIQQQGGIVRLKSEPGATSFQILLPIRSDRA